MSILYLAHGHPRFARGGGELAAYRLFEAIRSRGGFEQTGFLSAVPNQGLLPPGCEIMSIDRNEWLISGSSNSLMHDTTVQLTRMRAELSTKRLFVPVSADSCHHYVHIGLDFLIALKFWFPACPLVLTLLNTGPCVLKAAFCDVMVSCVWTFPTGLHGVLRS